ncbi:TonB-dependent receptor [Sphingosinicella ginsenosidimutans]|uniref:TonB-dependent receptor n=1 Tax=Allosphingosinicella ginsenosidimutans TaxID=1176539 RepID=A0A5C6TR78_9SPHN|nr:TonB-dependent receptor [Sphingosinicella ginsenosidimutans]TXC62208.1 TonB-dependent receptor [Sphingosinicella ginsenosidimutans]
MKTLPILFATTSLAFPATAMAQSSGTVDFENNNAIVVTGTRNVGVGGVESPDTSRARAVLNSTLIQHQTPGQSVDDIINSIPGVSFQNNDPFGSAGGTLTIRGFDNTRISQTFDGIPLNDTGNYALYSNQQLDPELIEQVNVNLGSTDVDSPTAAASGSTVNYRTRLPTRDFHVRLQGSVGSYDFMRVFGVIDTGEFTPWGTRAFVAASMAQNDNVFNHRGQIYKQQYNARIYQPLGSNGDFISVAGHYNQNRNNFFGSVPLRTDGSIGTPGTTPSRFPLTRDERFYTVARCTINTTATPGVADTANGCGSTFDERYNPSNTGNIRINSRFTLADGLVLTVDPSYQWVKANGGGTAVGREGYRDLNPAGGFSNCQGVLNDANTSCQTGYQGGTPYYGRDLNGDGDLLDTVRVLAPSQTGTHRIGVIAGLRYDINSNNTIRFAYSYDHGRHRQTGETGLLEINGEPFDVFPINDPLTDAGGNVLEKRDRLSYAILNQFSGEYRGEFLDSRLVVNLGIRAPFFTRKLNNFCATSSATGFVECYSTNTAGADAYAQFNPTIQGPQRRVFHYNAVLPTAGLTYDLTNRASLFFNYSRGLQVPGTDNLYNSFFFAPDTPEARPSPETTDNFDLGVRYRSRDLVAQLSGWYTIFQNRLASSYDPELDRTVYRNLGTVDKYGIDGYLSWQAIPQLQLSVFGSYLWSHIRDDVQIATVGGNPFYLPTAGRRESGAPVYTFGGRAQGQIGPIELGIQAKRTGPRYVNDVNQPIVTCNSGFAVASYCPVNTAGAVNQVIYGAKAPAYTLVDVDVRVPLNFLGLNDQTYFQFNVSNLFDKLYVGGFGGNSLNTSVPFVQIGAPRAFIGTLVVGF